MASDAVDPSGCANFVPLNALRAESQRELVKKASISQAKPGDAIFKIGEQAKLAIAYLGGSNNDGPMGGGAFAPGRLTKNTYDLRLCDIPAGPGTP